MYKITLSWEELIELKNLEIKYQWNWKILRRLRAIRYKNEWMSSWKIAEMVRSHHDTITNWMRLFSQEWFAWFCDLHYAWRRKSAYEQYKKEIEQMIEETIYNSYIELWIAVEQKFNLGKSKYALWRFCKKKCIQVTKNAI
jgi:transposase